jgi:type II secretory pathway pseudopilin PulG
MSRSRGAITLVEILISVTIISLSLLPILYLASRNVETARLDRVRIAAEAMCHNVLERLGRAEDNPERFLVPDSPALASYTGQDIWQQSQHLTEAIGVDAVEPVIRNHQLHMIVSLKKNTPAGMDTLTCKVTWLSDADRNPKPESITYQRFILREHR